MLYRYLEYWLKSSNQHGLHSPFVYKLYTTVICPKINTIFAEGIAIEQLRKQLLNNSESIEVLDLGAGSRVNNANYKTIKSIAKNAKKSKKIAQLLHRLVQYFAPKTMIDLGTSLGLTTLYFSKTAPNARIFTFEGCPQTAVFAQENFNKFTAHNIEIVVGNIDNTLPKKTKEISLIDVAFFDANHRYEPTIRYFENCLAHSHEDSLFIFDDIHWSAEMHAAWQYICQHAAVTVSIDLFFVGLVFFKKTQAKQHFILRF